MIWTRDCAFWGHQYEARYDYIPPDFNGSHFKCDMPEIVEAMAKKIYQHDICIKCGDVVENPNKTR